MPKTNIRYILSLIAAIFAISAPGQTDDYDYEFMPVEDDAPIMKLPADTTRNCVVTFTATTGDGNGGTLSATYYDGLGRIREEVHTGITPKKNDIVTFHEYNSLERKAWQGIPVATASEGTGCRTKDKYLEAAMQTTGDNHPYTQYSYERATPGRTVAVTGPGDAWHEAGKAVRYAYMANSGSTDTLRCLLHEITEGPGGISVRVAGVYADGTLSVTRTENEDGHAALVFTDRSGRKVLSRVIDREAGTASYDTYYVYDAGGNLRAVLPPELSANCNSGTIDSDMLEKYAYIYGYDTRNRMCLRKVPGAEPELFIYDAADRPVYRQDGKMREKGICEFTAYDVFGRECVTGVCSYSFPADTKSFFLETVCKCEYTGTGNGTMGYRITGISVPDATALTANFYDRYTFAEGNGILDYNEEDGYGRIYGKALGWKTGTVIARLSASDKVYSYDSTAIYYDDRGRIIQTKATNNLKGYERHYHAYDFTGNETGHKHTHAFRAGYKSNVEEVYSTTYDHAGRPLVTTLAVNGKEPIKIADREYDERGRLAADRKNGLPTLKTGYEYNIRSWPVKIGTGTRYVRLTYEQPGAGIKPRYGGDIAAMQWTVNSLYQFRYCFMYDGLARLTGAKYWEKESYTGRYDTEYSYDGNGNITVIKRKGVVSNIGARYTDKISVVYDGNRPVKATNQVKGAYKKGLMRFLDLADEDTEYGYDANGNMVMDLNKGITAMSYNVTNRPAKIELDNGKSVSYTYRADGEKLCATYVLDLPYIIYPATTMMMTDGERLPNGAIPPGTLPTEPIYPGIRDSLITEPDIPITTPYGVRQIDYCGNVIYDNYRLDKVLFDGGYVTFTNKIPIYHFYQKDHLGNVRIVFNQDGTVEQTNQYYPFGALFLNDKDDEVQRYKYNGKELDRLLGLDWYDYGARMYDPILCRWNRPDPLADDYLNVSPYVYCLNNPIKLIDIDGLKPGDFFRTADEAAIDFGLYYNDNSIREGVEYGSSIFKVMNNKGEIGYTYTIANRGTYKGVVPSETPWGFKTVAKVHAHGKYMKDYDNNNFSGIYEKKLKDENKPKRLLTQSELMKVTTENDIGNANTEKRDSYLASPNGILQKYDHQTGKIKVLSNEMPSDPNDPERLNRKQSFLEQNPYSIIDINNIFLYNQYLTIP